MEIKVALVPESSPEIVEIKCHEVSEEVREIVAFVKTRQGVLSGSRDGDKFEVPVTDICYIESVDNRSFLYTAKDSYEIHTRIYELEEALSGSSFVRVQKGMLINLMKVKSIKPGLSGRYVALLKNGEEIIISRKYVPDFKKALKGGAE